jgi:hypothetical protein
MFLRALPVKRFEQIMLISTGLDLTSSQGPGEREQESHIMTRTAARRSLRKALQTLLSRRTGTLRQPRARTKGEARVDLRSAGGDLQHLIGNVQKYFLLPFLCDVRHDIDPFCSRPCIISAR